MSESRDDETDSEAEGRKRRTSVRAGLVLALEYRNAGHLLVSYCTNLSRGGLFIPTKDPLEAGSPLTLSLDIPDHDEPAQLQAEVRWVRAFDTDEGPAGMGLAFSGIDRVLGDKIDGIVSHFEPLSVRLVGNRSHGWSHVSGQIKSLVTCELAEDAVSLELADDLAEADLVVVDVDSAPDEAVELLQALSSLERPPPRVALCSESDVEHFGRVSRHARTVRTPVDSGELRTSVLETVSQVYARRTGE